MVGRDILSTIATFDTALALAAGQLDASNTTRNEAWVGHSDLFAIEVFAAEFTRFGRIAHGEGRFVNQAQRTRPAALRRLRRLLDRRVVVVARLVVGQRFGCRRCVVALEEERDRGAGQCSKERKDGSNESEGGGGAGGENQEDESSDIVGVVERARATSSRRPQNGANLLA